MLLGQHGKDSILEKLKMLLLTEKISIIGGQLVQHGCDHVLIITGDDSIHILGKAAITIGLQRVGEAADDQLFLLAEVDSIMCLNMGRQPFKIGIC